MRFSIFTVVLLSLVSFCYSEVKITQVDIHERIFPDTIPSEFKDGDLSAVAMGGKIAFQFAVVSTEPVTAPLELDVAIKNAEEDCNLSYSIYQLHKIVVEANNNNCSKTGPGREAKPAVLKYLIRRAPFEVYEPLVKTDCLEYDNSCKVSAFVVDVTIPLDAKMGTYIGEIKCWNSELQCKKKFNFTVYPTKLPAESFFSVTHWLAYKPADLSTRDGVIIHSDEYYDLIDVAAKTLSDYGDDCIYTPLFMGKDPFIVTIKNGDSYAFDYSRFDRWVDIFLSNGYRFIEGRPLAGGGQCSVPTEGAYTGGLWVFDQYAQKSNLLKLDYAQYSKEFLPCFLKDFGEHLKSKGWDCIYLQSITDESNLENFEKYSELADLVKRYIPKARIIEALVHNYQKYSEIVDIGVWIPEYVRQKQRDGFHLERIENDKANWMYTSCTPMPPYPNTHLDSPLYEVRALLWQAFSLEAEGYLHWGANMYRGANPWKSSVGPIPNGSQNPGHPPGDNWICYPTKNGLIPSMRLLVFREGLQDYNLLRLLEIKSPEKAQEVLDKVFRETTIDPVHNYFKCDYEMDSIPYLKGRKEILDELARF